jgi:hypothetical protein
MYVAAQQREHPPIYQAVDGSFRPLRAALGFAPAELQTMAAKGLIAGGEVGELSPYAYVRDIGRGHAVIIHSGLMSQYYSAARAMTATDVGQFRGEQTPKLSENQAAEKIAELFKSYKEQEIGIAQAIPVTRDQQGWADLVAGHAAVFTLMHELAHISNERRTWLQSLWQGPLIRGDDDVLWFETLADSSAGDWLVDYLLNPWPVGPQRQMFYAGAEFALRVRMAMETAGIEFEGTHPKAGDRVGQLRYKLRSAAGSRTFYAIANTSLAFDQMWRSIEQLLLGQEPVFKLTLDDVLASMRTLTVEYLRGSSVEDLVERKPVAGEPGKMEIVLAPKEPLKKAIVDSAREYMGHVEPEVRALARARTGDVFVPGMLQSNILMAILNLVQP